MKYFFYGFAKWEGSLEHVRRFSVDRREHAVVVMIWRWGAVWMTYPTIPGPRLKRWLSYDRVGGY